MVHANSMNQLFTCVTLDACVCDVIHEPAVQCW